MTAKLILLSIASALLTVGCVTKVSFVVKDVDDIRPVRLEKRTGARPVEFAKLLSQIDANKQIGEVGQLWGCNMPIPIVWGQTRSIATGAMIQGIVNELRGLGIEVRHGDDELFADAAPRKADLVLGANLLDVQLRICRFQHQLVDYNGAAYAKIEWQVYSRSQSKIVYSAITEGGFKTENFFKDSNHFFHEALTSASRALFARADFIALIADGR